MRRRVFTILAAVSLLLCAATFAMWVRSYFRSDILNHTWSSGGWDLRSGIGSIGLMWDRERHYSPRGFIWLHDSYTKTRRAAWSEPKGTWGFDVNKIVVPSGKLGAGTYYQIVLPHWSLVFLFVLLPAAWTIRRFRATGRAASLYCKACGYDLRATPDRCPECGRVPEPISS